MTIAYRSRQHRPKFLNMVQKFEDVWDGHLERIATSRYRITQAFDGFRPVQSAVCQAELANAKFGGNETERGVLNKSPKSPEPNGVSPVAFSLENNGLL